MTKSIEASLKLKLATYIEKIREDSSLTANQFISKNENQISIKNLAIGISKKCKSSNTKFMLSNKIDRSHTNVYETFFKNIPCDGNLYGITTKNYKSSQIWIRAFKASNKGIKSINLQGKAISGRRLHFYLFAFTLLIMLYTAVYRKMVKTKTKIRGLLPHYGFSPFYFIVILEPFYYWDYWILL